MPTWHSARIRGRPWPHDAENERFLSQIELPDLENGVFAEILGLMMSPEARTPEGAARIGALAVEADTAFSEDEFVERFRAFAGTDDWPTVDFRPTCCNCATGQRQVWTGADGIPMSRAIASSCADSGFLPETVGFAGDRYMDGSRGHNYHAEIAADVDLDAALYIGPRIQAIDIETLISDDMAALAERGLRTLTMYGSEQLDAAGLNLMDATQRHRGFEIGRADGGRISPSSRSSAELSPEWAHDRSPRQERLHRRGAS